MFLKNCQIGNFMVKAFAIDCTNQPERAPCPDGNACRIRRHSRLTTEFIKTI